VIIPNGSTIHILERFVVCAANRWPDGLVITSARHFDPGMHAICQRVFGDKPYGRCEQGFIDQRGVFMDRKEAFLVAKAAGQISVRREKSSPADTLFSEDLY
jgi:hypothetical protein